MVFVIFVALGLGAWAVARNYFGAPSRDQWEGQYLVSYDTPRGRVAIAKTILTDILGAGRDAKIVGLPPAAAAVLQLMCPALVVLPESLKNGTRASRQSRS